MLGKLARIKLTWLLYLELLIIAFLYLKTMLPTVGFWDTGEFQTIPYSFDIAHPPGYPTYLIFGRIFYHLIPFGSIAWRMNFLALVSMLASLFLLSKAIVLITENKFITLLIVPMLGLGSQLFWQMALFADPHSLHLLLNSLIIYLLTLTAKKNDIKPLMLAAFVSGISLGNHLLTIFIIPALLIIIINCFFKQKKDKLKILIKSLIFLLLGSCIYALIWFIGISKSALTFDYQVNNWQNFSRHVLGTDFKFQMGDWTKGNFTDSLSFYLDFLTENAPVWLLLFSVNGIVWIFRKNKLITLILISTNLLSLIFTLRFQNGFLERYFLLNLWILMLLAVFGINWIYEIILKNFKKLNILFSGLLVTVIFNTLFFKIPQNYQKNDQSKNWSAYHFATEVLQTVPSDGYFVSWWSYATPIWYMQLVENQNPQMKVVNISKHEWSREIIKLLEIGKNVYVLEQPDDYLGKEYRLIKTGNIYKAEFKN